MNYCTACSRTFAEPGIQMNDGKPELACPYCGSDRFSERDYQERLSGMQVFDESDDGA